MYNYGFYDYGDLYDHVDNIADTGMAALTGVFIAFIIFMSIIALSIAIFIIIANWKIFKKAGRHGWESIIPVYNKYVMYEVCGYPGWYVFLGFIPIAGLVILFVILIIVWYSLSYVTYNKQTLIQFKQYGN